MITNKATKVFRVFNAFFLSVVALTCIFPILHILAVSFSSQAMVSAGLVTLIPKEFTLFSYEFLLGKNVFWSTFFTSVLRVLLGCSINMFFILTISYPLSRDKKHLSFRGVYVWYFFFTALFTGGLIPTYMLVQRLNLVDTIWALVLPTAVDVFNVVLMINFFRQIPNELEEAAFVDGAGYLRTLVQIFIPCSLPAIATLGLFTVVFHWNSWFDGLLYINQVENYPLQSYLQTVIVSLDFSSGSVGSGDYALIRELSDRTVKAAQIIIATIPILCIYPFLQKYFVSGIVVGGVKG